MVAAQQFRAAAQALAASHNAAAELLGRQSSPQQKPPSTTEPSPTAQPSPTTQSSPTTEPPPTTQPSPSGEPPSGVTYPRAVSEVRGPGATLVIPALQVHAPIVATGAVDGSMTIPADIHTVGWYNGTDITDGTTTSAPTPWPGQPGVSILAGHVDWAGEGPGALYYIGQLVVGDPIEVIGTNREVTYWRVSQSPITISKAALPDNLFANTGAPKLALVTCGGPYDPATRHYLDNVVVWATLVR